MNATSVTFTWNMPSKILYINGYGFKLIAGKKMRKGTIEGIDNNFAEFTLQQLGDEEQFSLSVAFKNPNALGPYSPRLSGILIARLYTAYHPFGTRRTCRGIAL